MNNREEIVDIDDETFISRKPQNDNYIFAERAEAISKRTAGSIKNSLRMIIESEGAGTSTLENLAEQREKLERAENDLDNINAITRATQKHLNSMRSFFGGMFSKKDTKAPPIPVPIPRSATIANVQSISKIDNTSRHVRELKEAPSGLSSYSRPETVEEEIDDGLTELGDGLGRLKHLALKLGDEIEDQSGLLDRITDKSERANDSIKHQNLQINQILKK